MQSDLYFVGYGPPKITQALPTTTSRQARESAAAGDAEARSPVSPTVGFLSCHPEAEVPGLIAEAHRWLGGNRSTDRSDEPSTGLEPRRRSLPLPGDAASLCRQSDPADLCELSSGWGRGAVGRVEAIKGDRRAAGKRVT